MRTASEAGRLLGYRLLFSPSGPTIESAPPRHSRRGGALNRACGIVFHARFFGLLTIAASAIFVRVDSASAGDSPRLRQLIRRAQIVAVGRITSIEDLDLGRIRVHEFLVEKELKPGEATEPYTIEIVSIADEPGAASAETGRSGIAFVKPLQRNSYLDSHLAGPGVRYEFTEKRDGWIEAGEARQLDAIVAPVATLIGQSRKPTQDAAARKQNRRALVFSLLSAPHPLLADDGIAGLSTISGLSDSLTDIEAGIITSTLYTPSLPISAREKLIGEIATLNLQLMVGTLRDLQEPALQQAAWAALRKMGAPVAEDDLRGRLAAKEPETRLAAARELLVRAPSTAIPLVAGTALHDRDKEVRLGAIEALGETKSADAVSPLEGTFVSTDTDERQASARALREIGGDAAANAFHRLAFTGPIDAQRYAVLGLLSLNVGRDDRRVRDIVARHKDAKVRDIIEHGIKLGHSH